MRRICRSDEGTRQLKTVLLVFIDKRDRVVEVKISVDTCGFVYYGKV